MAIGVPGTRPPSRALFVISVAAELSGLHPQTLRIYERRGLLEPTRTGGGSRRYSEDDLDRLRRIQELTDQGLNLAGVKRVLELEAEVERLQRRTSAAEAEAKAAHDHAVRQLRRDLVPLSQAIELFGHPRMPRRP